MFARFDCPYKLGLLCVYNGAEYQIKIPSSSFLFDKSDIGFIRTTLKIVRATLFTPPKYDRGVVMVNTLVPIYT